MGCDGGCVLSRDLADLEGDGCLLEVICHDVME